MTCDEYRKMASRCMDIDPDETGHGVLAHHLQECHSCRRWVELATIAERRLEEAKGIVPPPGLATAVKERVFAGNNGASWRILMPRWLETPIVALFVLVGVGLGAVTGNSLNQILSADRSEEMVTIWDLDRPSPFDEFIASPNLPEGKE